MRHKQKKPIGLSSIVMVVLGILVGAVLVFPYVMPMGGYVAQIEKIATDSIGEPVKIGSVRASLVPMPNLSISNTSIGDGVKIKSAVLTFSLFSSFSHKDLTKIELEAVSVMPEAYARLTQWKRTDAAPQLTKLKHVKLKEVKLELEGVTVPVLSGDIELSPEGKFIKAQFASSDGKVKLITTPEASGFLLDIAAKDWALPMIPSVIFSSFDAKVVTGQGSLNIKEIDGRLYDGMLKGIATVQWSNGWSIKADLDTENINFETAAKAFNPDISVGGKFISKLNLSAGAAAYGQLFDAPKIDGVFRLQNGHFNVDLGNTMRSMTKSGIMGGQTRFDELSGTVTLASNTYQLRQLKLLSGILSGNGSVDISPAKELSGRVVADLKGALTMTSGPLAVGGTVKEPKLSSAK